jgi:hypothetical protein
MDILAKPKESNMKDAHFQVTAVIPLSSGDTINASGDGVLVKNPNAGRIQLTASAGSSPFVYEEITVGGKDYSRENGGKWTVKPAGGIVGDFSEAADATYLGEETLAGGKAWHIKARATEDNSPLELWVREADGYPLKFIGQSSGAGTLTFVFDRFNIGASVSPPPASEVAPG